MTDLNLTTIDVEFATLIINAVLLIGPGLFMAHAKRIDSLRNNFSTRAHSTMFVPLTPLT